MEFPNPLSCKKDLIRMGVMKLRLSYKKDLKGTVLSLIFMHETIKKILQAGPLVISWSVWPGELSLGDHPTFGLNGLCLTSLWTGLWSSAEPFPFLSIFSPNREPVHRLVSYKRIRFSGLVSKLEYNFFQSVFWTGDGLNVGGPWSGFIVLTINCYCFKIRF